MLARLLGFVQWSLRDLMQEASRNVSLSRPPDPSLCLCRVRHRHKGRVPVGLLTDQESVIRTGRPRLRPLFSAALAGRRRRPSSQPRAISGQKATLLKVQLEPSHIAKTLSLVWLTFSQCAPFCRSRDERLLRRQLAQSECPCLYQLACVGIPAARSVHPQAPRKRTY